MSEIKNGTPAPKGAGKGTRVTEYTDAISVSVVNRSGVEVGTVSIDPKDFGGKISKQLLHEVVVMHRANQRAGTHSTLRRGEVFGEFLNANRHFSPPVTFHIHDDRRYKIASMPLRRITLSSTNAGPVGLFAPRSSWDTYPVVRLR